MQCICDVSINDEPGTRQRRRDVWWFADCIAHASRSGWLHPGAFFGSGTVGNGCGIEPMRFLSPGDVVELGVGQIGIPRNRIVKRAG